jgi:hypothetical protein
MLSHLSRVLSRDPARRLALDLSDADAFEVLSNKGRDLCNFGPTTESMPLFRRGDSMLYVLVPDVDVGGHVDGWTR